MCATGRCGLFVLLVGEIYVCLAVLLNFLANSKSIKANVFW